MVKHVDDLLICEYHQATPGRPGDRWSTVKTVHQRKVCTPQSAAPANSRGSVNCRNGPQKQTALPAALRDRQVMVKRRRKRPPARAAMSAARQPPLGARPSRDQRTARRSWATNHRRADRGCGSHPPSQERQSRVGCTRRRATCALDR